MRSSHFLLVVLILILFVPFAQAQNTTNTTATTNTSQGVGYCFMGSGYDFYQSPIQSGTVSGKNYAVMAKPGITTTDGLKIACTEEDFKTLLQLYCASGSNNEPVQASVRGDGYACSANGCGGYYCKYLTETTKPTGVCLAHIYNTNLPGFWDPDVGPGYAKLAKPGINDIAGLSAACTESEIRDLIKSVCSINTGGGQTGVATYGPGGGRSAWGGKTTPPEFVCSSTIVPTPTPTAFIPACNATYVEGCSELNPCMAFGGHWCGSSCQKSPCSSVTPTPASNQTQTTTSVPLAPTTQPTTTATPSPIQSYTPYTPQPKPQASCNTDQDCSWLITNGCSESAGAGWSCSSLIQPPEKSKSDICPQALSPRPSTNCGCIQNNCAVFEGKEKPKEPPKKIGNTEIDATNLLGVVIQIEQLKVRFDFLKSAVVKLSNYYNSTNNIDLSAKWARASIILQDSIDQLDKIKDTIKSKLDNFTIEDLRETKKDIKRVIEKIREIVRIVLE